MQCAEALRVQGYFDLQLDALAAGQIERHVEHCAECRTLLHELREVRLKLRQELKFELTPAALRSRIDSALDASANSAIEPTIDPAMDPTREATPRRPEFTAGKTGRKPARYFWWGAFSGSGFAAAAVLLGFALTAARPDPVLEQVVDAHIRSLVPEHLTDVVSSERHTVKPWFSGHAEVSPVVVDFESEGYKLLGGRADYIQRQRAAVVVYRHGAHIINVFSWATDAPRALSNTMRNGYRLEFWRLGDLEYCAVSDTGWEELHALARLIKDSE